MYLFFQDFKTKKLSQVKAKLISIFGAKKVETKSETKAQMKPKTRQTALALEARCLVFGLVYSTYSVWRLSSDFLSEAKTPMYHGGIMQLI